MTMLLWFQITGNGALGSQIIEAANYDQVIDILKNIPHGSLIAMDCDNVIMAFSDKILRPPSRKVYDQLIGDLRLDLKDQTMLVENRVIPLSEYVHGHLIQDANIKLVDQRIPSLIEGLQNQHDVIALTAGKVGVFSIFESMEDFRIQQLNSLGVHFKNRITSVVAQTLEVEGAEPLPIFKEGVLLTAKSSKALCLQALIDYLQKTWPCLVVIDDRRHWIDELFDHFQSRFLIIAIHYRDEQIISDVPDQSLGQKQFNHLRDHFKWLSDQETTKL